MIRFLSWLLPDPPGIRHRYTLHRQPLRLSGERLSEFRDRQIDAVLDRSANLGGCYAMENEDDVKEAA